MKFKLDENLPGDLADDLVKLGHDVDTVHSELLTGAEDITVLHAASLTGRILMTLDKGVASLVHRAMGEHCGIVLFRPDASGRLGVLRFVRSRLALLLELELKGRITVVGATRIRVR